MTTQDKIAAGIIAFVGNLLPFLVVTHVLAWTGDTTASAMLVVNSAVTLGGLVFQGIQHKAPSGP